MLFTYNQGDQGLKEIVLPVKNPGTIQVLK